MCIVLSLYFRFKMYTIFSRFRFIFISIFILSAFDSYLDITKPLSDSAQELQYLMFKKLFPI